MNLINILSFILGVVAYSLKELQSHNKLKWMDDKKPLEFWGEKSDLRKYKSEPDDITINDPDDLLYEIAPKTWYYNFFKIKYKERWPTSATLTVLFTDGAHLVQFAFKVFLILTLVTYEPVFNMVWDFIGYFALWGITFTVTYKLLSK